MKVLDTTPPQKPRWPQFGPLEVWTMAPAAQLVRHAGIRPGHRVLDVACGTGVVALTAARLGAQVTGLDLTPELLARARAHAAVTGVDVEWHEGDVEQLPFADGTFDVVVSQFGHMFARPELATAEMLRVLKTGGTIAFSTWPPELLIGRIFMLVGRYMPPPPPGFASPAQWGDPAVVRERLGAAVRDIRFDREVALVWSLSPQHHRVASEETAPPLRKLVESLTATEPAKLETFRREYDALVAEYFDQNVIRQGYLMTRATKV